MKVAVIGAGLMGRNHIQLISSMQGVTLVGVVDPVFRKEGSDDNQTIDFPKFASFDDLLSISKPDVVHVVSPPGTHAKFTEQAILAGCHVYVEKPFVQTAETAEKLLSLAESRDIKVCAGHQLMWHPSAQLFWSKMKSVGDVVHVDSVFSFQPSRRKPSGALQDVNDQLLDVLPHPCYLMLKAMSRTSAVNGELEVEGIATDVDGEIRVLVRKGSSTGFLNVSLRGRPVDSYLRVIGTRATFEVDLVIGSVNGQIAPRKSAISVLSRPYTGSLQTVWRSTRSLFSAVFSRRKGYAGLRELVEQFYSAIENGTSSPVSPQSICETVSLCEKIEDALINEKTRSGKLARERYEAASSEVDPVRSKNGAVAVTGAGGFLGRAVVRSLRSRGLFVRALVRTAVPFDKRIPDVEYIEVDLAQDELEPHLKGVGIIVHLAAETSGDKTLHERNTVIATRRLLQTSAALGIKRFVNISSIAVLAPGQRRSLSEDSPVDQSGEARGPYVWAKAEAEKEARRFGEGAGICVKTLRPGPLVDMEKLDAPGRLGRLLGSVFVAVGPRQAKLPVCDVKTMAKVIEHVVNDFERCPDVLNVVELSAPTRRELVEHLVSSYPGTRVWWLPRWFLRVLSGTLIAVQRLAGKKQPLNVYAAFQSESYDTSRLQVFLRGSDAQ
jgi:predicted dehydrogenase/nucleoside-diphosphate-sugar epimerase